MSAKNYVLQILGTAQDAGYPQLNCSCKNCAEARKNTDLKRNQSSLALIDKKNKKSYVFDITPSFPEQLSVLNETAKKNNIPTNHLDGLFITHAHLGHYTGMLFLGKEAMNVKNMPVYISKKMYDFLNHNQPWSDLINNYLDPVILKAEKYIKINDSFSVRTIKIPHRNEYADTAAFQVKTKNTVFIYLPDIDSWNGFFYKILPYFEESDYIFIDGTFFSRKELGEIRGRKIEEVPHPPIVKSMELFAEYNLQKKTFFTHFNHTNPILDKESEEFKTVIKQGFRILNDQDIFKI